MCRPKLMVLYVEACGHYTMSYGEEIPPGACPQAMKRRISERFTEWSPCAALICELEIQRKGRWFWDATVDGLVIDVNSNSSGHCEAWQEKGFKRPDYRALAEVEKAENRNQEKKEEKAANSESGTSGSSTTVESGISTSITTTTEVDDPKGDPSQGEGRRNKFKRWLLSLPN